jgi:hypothetical protein
MVLNALPSSAGIELTVGDLARGRDQRGDPAGDERRRPDPERDGGQAGGAEQHQERGAVAVGQRRADLRERLGVVDRVLQLLEIVVDGGRHHEGQPQARASVAERVIDHLVAPPRAGERPLGLGGEAAVGPQQRDRAQAGLVVDDLGEVDRRLEREEVGPLREPAGDLVVQALGQVDQVGVAALRLLHGGDPRRRLAGGDVGSGLAELIDQVRRGRERRDHDQHERGRELELEG